MFDGVTKRRGGSRLARRSFWILGSTALQVGIGAVVVFLSAAAVKTVTDGPLVPVRLFRAAAPARPELPPPPPAMRKSAVAHKPKVPPRPQTALIQPKGPPPELNPPAPSPPEQGPGTDDGVEGGAIGGAVGGTIGGAVGGAVAAAPGPAPPPPPAPPGPVEFDTRMKPPVLVDGPPLEYTPQALEREIEGVMVVQCIVRVDGSVHACRVVRGLPFMDHAVVSNLEQRRYRPATLDGRALDVQYTFTIRLKLPQ